MPTQTSNFSYNKPLVNNATDADLWGGQLNTNWDDLDTDLALTTVSKTATFSVAATEFNFTYLVDSSSGSVTINLPAVANVFNGFVVRFKAVDLTNSVTIDADGSETIDGETTKTIDAEDDIIEIVSDDTGWQITVAPPVSAGRLLATEVFITSGTWNKPAGTITVEVECAGSGGGGGMGITSGTGGAGNTSSFGSHISSTGGTGGVNGQSDFDMKAAKGTATGTGVVDMPSGHADSGGAAGLDFRGGDGYGIGQWGGNGGLGIVTATTSIGATETVTIGAAGTGGTGGGGADGEAGKGGYIIVRSYS